MFCRRQISYQECHCVDSTRQIFLYRSHFERAKSRRFYPPGLSLSLSLCLLQSSRRPEVDRGRSIGMAYTPGVETPPIRERQLHTAERAAVTYGLCTNQTSEVTYGGGGYTANTRSNHGPGSSFHVRSTWPA